MSEKLIFSTTETSHWYAVLSVIQAKQQCVLPIQVENYLVRLFVNAEDSIKKSLKNSLVTETPMQQWDLNELKHYADHCLLVAGLFPECLLELNISVREIVARGKAAYKELLQRSAEHEPYEYMIENFDLLIIMLLQIYAMNKPDLQKELNDIEAEKLGAVNQTLRHLSPVDYQDVCFN